MVERGALCVPPPVDPLDLVRVVAVARILMPKARVRLSAGRLSLSREAQLLAFYAGANSIFWGEKLLTRANPDVEADRALLRDAGPSRRRRRRLNRSLSSTKKDRQPP